MCADEPSRQALTELSTVANSVAQSEVLESTEKIVTLCTALADIAALLNELVEAPPRLQPEQKPANSEGFLQSIDKLLNAVAHLMKREQAIDRQAIEYLRLLRVRIRFALSTSRTNEAGSLPSEAPAKWLERANKGETPVDFIRREYSPWIGKGLSRIDIKRLDKSLYNSLCNWLTIHKELPPDVALPTKKELNDKKLEAAPDVKAPSRSLKVSEMAQQDAEKMRLYDLARSRRKR
jgi:hypothetical protein